MRMHMRMHMVKVISLSNKAYATLKAFKQGDDSFSDVVLKLTEKKKGDLMKYFGKWPGTDEDLCRMKREIEEGRKRAKLREVIF
jgi:predicted CopG family antitoxin